MIEGYENQIKPVFGGPLDGQARVCHAGERSVVVSGGGRKFVYRIDAEMVVFIGWTDDAGIADRAASSVAAGTFGSPGHGEAREGRTRRTVSHRPGF